MNDNKTKSTIINTPEGLEIVKTMEVLHASIETKMKALQQEMNDFGDSVKQQMDAEYSKLIAMYGLDPNKRYHVDPEYLDHNVAFLAECQADHGLGEILGDILGRRRKKENVVH